MVDVSLGTVSVSRKLSLRGVLLLASAFVSVTLIAVTLFVLISKFGVLLGLGGFIGAVALIVAALCLILPNVVPEGYQDDNGFHEVAPAKWTAGA